MKKTLQTIWIALIVVCTANAQQEKGIIGYNNWLNNWTEFKPNKVEYGEANQILAGNISINTKLLKRNIYVLQGQVYLTNNAVLTIEPGTVILGDADTKGTLVITKGASIIADGLETDPIVFTSSKGLKKAGDWGGIVILGDAPINKFGGISSITFDLNPALTIYGGQNVESNSGIMRYVRVEFAGKKVKGSTAMNAVTFAGVGNKTILENVMVSNSGGDSFAMIGGELALSKFVSYHSVNDDFKFTQGTQCKIFNSLAVRSSYVTSNKDGSRCMEVNSYDKKEETDFSKKQTLVTASNITMLNDSQNISADIQSGLVKEAIYIGNDAALEIKRSVVSGFNPAVVLNNQVEINDKNLKKIKFEEMYFNMCKGNIFTENNSNNEDLENWYGNSIFFNVYSQTDNNETFIDIMNPKRPDFRIKLGKITAASSKF